MGLDEAVQIAELENRRGWCHCLPSWGKYARQLQKDILSLAIVPPSLRTSDASFVPLKDAPGAD